MPLSETAVTRLQRLLVWAVALVCGAYWAFENVPVWLVHISHDAGWDLYAANAVLHGVRLNGPRLVEVNPPFLVWFFALPSLLAKALHVSLPTGFRIFLIGGSSALLAWSATLYRRVCRASLLNTWIFTLFLMYVASGPVSLEDRGQREYFVTFLLLPYALWAAARIGRERLSAPRTSLIAILVVVAVCLKPQHVLDVIVVELLVLLRLRSIRSWFHPALLIIAGGPVLYLASVWLFDPSYLRNVVPLLRDTYWGLDQPWTAVLRSGIKLFAALGVALLLYLGLRCRLRVEPFIAVLLAISAGALAAYLQQHKGWSYQGLVAQQFSYLAVAAISLDVTERLAFEPTTRPGSARFQLSGPIVAAVIAFLFIGSVQLLRAAPIGYPQVEKTELAAIYAPYPPGTAVDLLAVDPWEWPEVLEQHKVWASRYMHLWLLPAILRSQDPMDRDVSRHLSPRRVEELSDLLRQNTAEDLAYWKPAVVAIDPCGTVFNVCGALSRSGYAGLLDWFLRSPQFRAQWSHYRYQKNVGQIQVYVRIN